MASDLSLTKNTGVVSQICGDAHVQNLGAYTGPDGGLIFDINDFDETIRGPFEWDVKRMATSILLAGREAEIKGSGCVTAAKTFLDSYTGLMERLSRMPVLEAARFQVHGVGSASPISEVLRKAERETPMHSLERLTEAGKGGRVFKSAPPLLERVTGARANAVLASLKTYVRSLLPERQRFFAQFRPIDVAFKVVGTGSVGLRDFCVYMEGNGSDDPLFLQVKQEVSSGYAAYAGRAGRWGGNEGERVVEGQRAMQLQADPLLGWTRLGGRDYLVRQLNDHKASVDVSKLERSGLSQYANVCGELLARGHARAGDPRAVVGYVGNADRFKEAVLEFAQGYAEQTVRDWKRLRSRRGGTGAGSKRDL